MSWIHELPSPMRLKINISELHIAEGYREPEDRDLATCVFSKDRFATDTPGVSKCMELLIAGAKLILPNADSPPTYEIDHMNNTVTLKHPDTWSEEEVDIFQDYLKILSRSNEWKLVTSKSPFYGGEPYVLEKTWGQPE